MLHSQFFFFLNVIYLIPNLLLCSFDDSILTSKCSQEVNLCVHVIIYTKDMTIFKSEFNVFQCNNCLSKFVLVTIVS